MNDPTGVELRQYTDDERTTVVAGGREYEVPPNKLDIFTLRRNAVLGDGMPVHYGITVRDGYSGELLVSFGTRIEAGVDR